ncbi:alcohol dehydrogenase catalytic domain-containing protein [Spirosoma arcticum]
MKSLFKLPMTLGWDAAGVVEEWGSDVTGFQKGDAVYGVPNLPVAMAVRACERVMKRLLTE